MLKFVHGRIDTILIWPEKIFTDRKLSIIHSQNAEFFVVTQISFRQCFVKAIFVFMIYEKMDNH